MDDYLRDALKGAAGPAEVTPSERAAISRRLDARRRRRAGLISAGGAIVLVAVISVGVAIGTSGSARVDPAAPVPTPTARQSADIGEKEVVLASLVGLNTESLEEYSGSKLPAAFPDDDEDLPSVVEDPPGRASLVVLPQVPEVNRPVESWDEIALLFYGSDGRWRRQSLGDFGIDDSWIYSDTYNAGALSSDGKWWAGTAADGVLLLNLESGRLQVLGVGPLSNYLSWVPGQTKLLVGRQLLDLDNNQLSQRPYNAFEAGFEPDGTPISLRSDGDMQELIEWDGSTPRVRSQVPELRGNRYRFPLVVAATSNRFAASSKAGIGVFDSTDGRFIAELEEPRDNALRYTDTWLDAETLLIAQQPDFLAWRPATGELLRATDARALGSYWSYALAPNVD